MGNEEQQLPLPEQEQQGYYGWQYDQDEAEEAPQSSSVTPPAHPFLPPSSQPPPSSLPSQETFSPNVLPDYQQPIQDMGTSLGYGQGMEYQYFDAPQPSQPIAQLRQERLLQLREERMRRQQRRMSADITTIFPGGSKSPKWSPLHSVPPSGGSPTASGALPISAQLSPLISLPVRPSTVPPAHTVAEQLEGADILMQPLPATAPSQDTGMIQRVRIGRATAILTAAFIASRVLGLLRTSMFAFVFGTSTTSDAYLQAFLVPDLIFNIVAGGALSSAFIPVFTQYMIAERDEKSAWHIASSALNLALAVMSGLALIAIIFAPVLVPVYNPGIHDPHELGLIVSLTRIMLLQSVVLGGGVIMNSVLNAQQDFKLPAIGTVLYNVGLIAGLIPGIYFAFHGQRNDQVAVYAATWGVVLGAVLQVGIQIPGLFKVKMQYSRVFDWHHPAVIQIGRQMVPRVVNAAMLYFSTFVDRALIQLLAGVAGVAGVSGLITQYYQAFQLVLLPLGIFGMSMSTAAFPTMAENMALGRLDRTRNTILETLRSILFMSIPSSIGLIILSLPVIQVLLQHGSYTLNDAESTAVPLIFFAIGLAGLSAVEILTRSFYAMRDSKTPVTVSIAQFIFKIALSLLLINVAVIWGATWGMGALAFSTSAAGLLEAVVMFWLLHQRLGGLQLRETGRFIGRVLFAAVVMGVCVLVARVVLDWVLVTTREQSMGLGGTLMAFVKLLIELFVGVFVYVRCSRFLNIEELAPIKRVLDRLRLSWI